MAAYTKTVQYIGRQKDYERSGLGHFVTFTDNSKAIMPTSDVAKVSVGDTIEVTGRLVNGWVNSCEYRTTVGHAVASAPISGSAQMGYVPKPVNGASLVRGCVFEEVGKVPMTVDIRFAHRMAYQFLHAVDGYGTLFGEFCWVAGTLEVHRVTGFCPDTDIRQYDMSLADFVFGESSISGCDADGTLLARQASELPFGISPVFNKVKKALTDQRVKIEVERRTRGSMSLSGGTWKETRWYDVLTETWDFSGCDFLAVTRVANAWSLSDACKKLLKDVKAAGRYHSFTELRKRLADAGHLVTNTDLQKLFFHDGYNVEVFKMLEAGSLEIFVDSKSFVFQVPRKGALGTCLVCETPDRASATYIFDDRLGVSDLLVLMKVTPKMRIRRDKSLQEAMGYLGCIVHKTTDGWVEKFQELTDSRVTEGSAL